MRLIDADALKTDHGMKDDCEDCEKELKGSVKQCQYDAVYTKMDFCGWIDAMPTIYPETQKTGRWINEGRFANYHGGNVYRCSRCGNRIIEKEPDDFCKHCGSDNRGGDYE